MSVDPWSARGQLFENCSCQLVCPGHIHFEQLCTHDTCRGYWAFSFDEGKVGGSDLSGRRCVIAFESPRRMVDGGWTQILFIDDDASESERDVLESMFFGRIGGPWEILARFVETRLPTRQVPIAMTITSNHKELAIDGVVEASVAPIRGRKRGEPVRFENIFNQIHSSSQVLAFGTTRYDDGTIQFDNENTHGLWSEFTWNVTAD